MGAQTHVNTNREVGREEKQYQEGDGEREWVRVCVFYAN
jgi:hypothetical protein